MKKLLAVLAVPAAGFGVLVYLLPGEAVFALLTGWLTFPARVLPRMTADRGAVAVGLAAVVLFTAGIHLAGRAWAPRWRLRWAPAGTAGVFLLFASGVALVAAVHQTAWLAAGREPLLIPVLKGDGRLCHFLAR